MFITAPKSSRRPPKPKKPRTSARHALRKKLIVMITEGKFAAGEKLVQSRLARKFGVSVGVMREALLDVQAHGLVETHDNRGFFVRKLDSDVLLDLFDLRAVLEGLAARKACAHATPEDIRELQAMIDKMCAAQECGESAERGELDRTFHDRINQISRSEAVLSLTRQCSLFGKVVYTATTTAVVRQRHEILLRAVAENRPEQAEQLAREHVDLGRAELERLMREGRHDIFWLSTPPANGC